MLAAVVVVLVVVIVLVVRACTAAPATAVDTAETAATTEAATTVADDAAETAATSEAATTALVSTTTTGVEDPWVEGGVFTTGNDELDQKVKELCDSWSTDGNSAADNAYDAYNHVCWYDYVERDDNQNPEGPDWDVQYALDLINNNEGNCYNLAAMVQFVLRYFGYSDATAEPCIILLQSGNHGQHGITFVTDTDGSACLCDQALGYKGWMLPADSYTYTIEDIGQNG